MRATQLGIVVVMMVVRTAPNAARTQRQDAKEPHESLRHPRPGQDRMVLLIVINDEQPEQEESAQNAADAFCQQTDIPVRPGQCHEDQKCRGEDMPPTSYGGIGGVRFSGQDEFPAAFYCVVQTSL